MFYLLEITNYNDGTPVAKGVYQYETKTAAMASFHTKLGGAMKNPSYDSELVQIITETGMTIANEYWKRPEEE